MLNWEALNMADKWRDFDAVSLVPKDHELRQPGAKHASEQICAGAQAFSFEMRPSLGTVLDCEAQAEQIKIRYR
jgi:hypothetical protein